MSKPVDPTATYVVDHNYLTKKGKPFTEIVVPLAAIPFSGSFLSEDEPFIILNDRAICRVNRKQGLGFMSIETIENLVNRIYFLTFGEYLDIWAKRTGQDRQRMETQFMYLAIEKV